MDKIPEPLIPITNVKEDKDGNIKYYSNKFEVPKEWTVYTVEGYFINYDGNSYENSTLNDVKKVGKLKQPYRWYIQKGNEPFDTPFDLRKEPPPIYKSPSVSPRSRSRSGNSRGGNKSRFRRGTRRRNRRGTRRK